MDPQSEGRIAACIRKSAEGKPWLEKTLWGLRDQEAGWIGAEIKNDNGSHDLGPLQINSWWVPKLAAITGRPESHVRYWLKQDACFNVDAARWIFLSCLGMTRNYWDAVGAYHSPTTWRRRRYASNVAIRLERRFGSEIFGKPHSVPPTRCTNTIDGSFRSGACPNRGNVP
nr:lytic transglycosylase domain-containing protein [Sphingomonas panacis]